MLSVISVGIAFLKGRQFGGKITKNDLERYQRSSNWKKGQFENLIETKMDINLGTMPGLIMRNMRDKRNRTPQDPLAILPLDRKRFQEDIDRPKFIWYGHSVLLLQVKGKNILIDPMFGPNAAPIAPFPSKRFSENTLDIIDRLPPIDLVLQTHDHYDHLDLDSITKLKNKVDHWWVAMGVERHLVRWEVKKEGIKEFDWWDTDSFQELEITFTPSRHFSGRGLKDRAKSLWGGWVIKSEEHSIYWSGDGGYGPHFKEVGERLGPFDWGFMECGQYDKLWQAIHLMPEESIWAAQDAKVDVAIPVHWAGFRLALHPWKEPVKRFVMEAESKGVNVAMPRLGEMVKMGEVPTFRWWEEY
ncbi:MBL fold metallo-hydrolase [Algivirga pacifica]|uniref:MBL fold metallo-hydrolase n=2 Tax=Algivirga pacifica TaxID=1162670 RepID=A0ABP9DAK3_9BACT